MPVCKYLWWYRFLRVSAHNNDYANYQTETTLFGRPRVCRCCSDFCTGYNINVTLGEFSSYLSWISTYGERKRIFINNRADFYRNDFRLVLWVSTPTQSICATVITLSLSDKSLTHREEEHVLNNRADCSLVRHEFECCHIDRVLTIWSKHAVNACSSEHAVACSIVANVPLDTKNAMSHLWFCTVHIVVCGTSWFFRLFESKFNVWREEEKFLINNRADCLFEIPRSQNKGILYRCNFRFVLWTLCTDSIDRWDTVT